MVTVRDFICGGLKITADGDCSHIIKRRLLIGKKVMSNLDSILKSRDIDNKGLSSQGCGFSSSHIWMWGLDYKEIWAPKNWCFWTVLLEKTLESPLNCKEINPVNPKGNQSWIFIERTDAEIETPSLATWCEEMTYWKRPLCWERLKAGREGDDRGWDGWMTSPTWWTWVWASSRNWWWTGKPGVVQSHGVAKSWTWLSNWTELKRSPVILRKKKN